MLRPHARARRPARVAQPRSTLCVFLLGLLSKHHRMAAAQVGNRAFASEYHSLINDHWAIVNDQVRWG